MRSVGILETYADFISLPKHAAPLTLGEGGTPLIRLSRLHPSLADLEVYVKFEGLNPTGSFKDRGMVAAVSEAVGNGATTVICASTGNTAAAAAAYAARAGIRAIVVIPEGNVARGKLAAAAMYGAQIIQISGSFDDALTLVQELAATHPIALVNSVNPYRLEGQKTAAFEVCDELGRAPDVLCIPVGNAGNISSYHLGFTQYDTAKQTGVPQLIGVQAAGAAPLVLGAVVEKPETIATAIRIGNPARGAQAVAAAQETRGTILAASDEEILRAQSALAHEGIWVEPASAASLAGLIKSAESGFALRGKQIVLVCTGHGLKDPDIVPLPDIVSIPATYDSIAEHIAA